MFTGEELLNYVAVIFSYAWRILNTPLFTIRHHEIALWNICITFVMLEIFRDFLDIIGIWGYSADDFEEDEDLEFTFGERDD